jgi:type IV pilus assembly protein PilE
MIELLIVVVIVAILATMSTSAYRSQVTKATRAAAKSCLSQYAQFMERYNTTRFSYVGADAVGVWPTLDCANEGNMSTRYAFSVDNLTATAYRLRAIPTTLWATRDSRCGTLSLTQTGARSAGSGSVADIAYCW